MAFPETLEADYQNDLGPEKIRVARQTSVLAGGLFSAFAVLDVWAIPSALIETWGIRVCVVAMVAAVIALSEEREFFVRHYAAVVGLEIFCFGVAIEAMIALSEPSDLAWSAYYAGLILVVMALYTWTFLATRLAVTIGVLLVTGYLVIAIFVQGMLATGSWPTLLTNVFFVVAANIVGLTSQRSREGFTRANYLLRHSLERDLEMKEEAKRQSDFLAEHDVLTGLPNRIQLMRRMREMIERSRRQRSSVAAIFIDLDGFKPVNDTRGHEAGDQVLRVIAGRFRSCVRRSDIIARLGGDEFVVALEVPETKLGLAREVAAKLEAALETPVVVGGEAIRLGVSIGIAIAPHHATKAEALLAAADARMYEAKRGGKGGVCAAPLPDGGAPAGEMSAGFTPFHTPPRAAGRHVA